MRRKSRFPSLGIVVLLAGITGTAQACSLAFTSPGHKTKVTTANINVFGAGGGDASTGDLGTVTATLNGSTFFSQSGSFTAMVSFLESRGVPVVLRPGANYLSVSGSVGGCSASDAMTVYYDPSDVDPLKNGGGGGSGGGGGGGSGGEGSGGGEGEGGGQAGGNGPGGGPPDGPPSCAGNPINFAMGNKVQEEEDYRGATEGYPLRFVRLFNSADGYWRHNYATRLKVEASRVTLLFPDGQGMPFARSGSTITPAPDELGSLTQTSSGWLYVAGDNTRYEFNTSGRLVKQSEPYGLYHNLVYGSGGIVTVADSFGNSLSFTEDVHFQPRTLTAPGVSIAYNYDGPVRLLTAVKTTGSEVGTRTYHYENSTYSRFLTGITDERGIRFATFAYDSAGRAISSTHAGGADLTQVAYNTNGTVTVTNPLGKQATYHFTVINGVKRISQIVGVPSPNCPASNSTYTYDTRGLLVSQTDNKGNITEYAYNARGLRTSNIQAVGTSQQRVTTATWHPSLPLPMQITEPDRTVTYTRDALGRVLTRTISD